MNSCALSRVRFLIGFRHSNGKKRHYGEATQYAIRNCGMNISAHSKTYPVNVYQSHCRLTAPREYAVYRVEPKAGSSGDSSSTAAADRYVFLPSDDRCADKQAPCHRTQ